MDGGHAVNERSTTPRAYVHRVQYYETDRMGVTHHSNYIRWMEEARVDLLEQIGWGYDRMEQEGILSPVTGVQCRFRAPTTFGDSVEIEARVSAYRGVSLEMSYRMRRQDGELVCEGSSTHCFLDRAGGFLRLRRDFPDLHARLLSLAQEQPEGKASEGKASEGKAPEGTAPTVPAD